MNNFWIVLFHTYTSKLKTKSFILTTVITAILLIGLTNMTNIIEYFTGDDYEKVAVMDETDELLPAFEEQLKAVNDELGIEPYTGSQAEAEEEIEKEVYKGLLIIKCSRL